MKKLITRRRIYKRGTRETVALLHGSASADWSIDEVELPEL
jgi:hypothetical protein